MSDTDETKHTQGKISVRRTGILATVEGNVHFVARVERHGEGNTFTDEDRANGERLALAWNCHDDLLAALRKFGRHAENCDFHVYDPSRVKTAEDDCDCGLAAALKKAEGR